MTSERAINAVTVGPAHVSANEGATIFDGPEAVDLFALTVIKHGLDFEIRTGMKMTGASMLNAANRYLGTNYRRKQQAYDHLVGLLSALDEEGE